MYLCWQFTQYSKSIRAGGDTSNVSHHAYQDLSSTYRFLAISLATGIPIETIVPIILAMPNVIAKQSAMIPKHQAFPGARLHKHHFNRSISNPNQFTQYEGVHTDLSSLSALCNELLHTHKHAQTHAQTHTHTHTNTHTHKHTQHTHTQTHTHTHTQTHTHAGCGQFHPLMCWLLCGHICICARDM